MELVTPKTVEEQLSYWTNRRRDPMPRSFVYVVQATGDTPIKVGVATDIKKRLASLQTGNPRPLELRAVLVGDREFEQELHKMLGYESRLTGEWFHGPCVEPFLGIVQTLATLMLTAYQTTKRVPNFRDFPPFKEQRERRAMPRITDEHLAHRGRLSSAVLPDVGRDPDLEFRRFKAAQREPVFSPHKPPT